MDKGPSKDRGLGSEPIWKALQAHFFVHKPEEYGKYLDSMARGYRSEEKQVSVNVQIRKVSGSLEKG